MRLFAPKYYRLFKCIGGACTKNCCIGWEIDIDEDTKRLYDLLPGDIGKRIRASISEDGECPHFKLCDGERCANLRADNLCSIIAECGEDIIPVICREHPRFYNSFYDRCEVGVALACPSAAELILAADDHRAIEVGVVDVDECGGAGQEYEACRKLYDMICVFSRDFTLYKTLQFLAYHSKLTLPDLIFDVMLGKSISTIHFPIHCINDIEFARVEDESPAVISLMTSFEVLDDGYEKRIENALYESIEKKESIRKYIEENEDSFFALLQYFLYRYMPTGFNFGYVYGAVLFAVISSYTIFSLSLFGGDTIVNESVDYSRNIEYSDCNVFDFIEKTETDDRVGIGFILDILGDTSESR